MDEGPDEVRGDAERWYRPTAGLGTLLTVLRVRVALWILLSAGALAARALALGQWPRIAAFVGASLAALIGAAMIFGISRYLAHPLSGGRALGVLAILVLLAALGVDLSVLAGMAADFVPGAAPLTVVLFAELVAFASLAPLVFAHASLASRIGATDVRRRSLTAGALVLLATAACALVVLGWTRLPDPRFGAALASGVSLFAVIALAKVLGATRFLLSFLLTMHAPRSSEAPLELRAWHRA